MISAQVNHGEIVSIYPDAKKQPSKKLVKIASKERNDTIIKAYEKITDKFPNAMKRFNIKNKIEYAKQRI